MSGHNDFNVFLEDLMSMEDSGDETVSYTLADPDMKSDTTRPKGTGCNPFKFLDAYNQEDWDIFFGRDMEIRELYHSVFSHKLTVVFGASGAGKTSLVQCGFASRLKPEKTALFSIRSGIDPMASMRKQCIDPFCSYDDSEDLFSNLSRSASSLRKTMVLFFDQFEESFILQPRETRKHLALLFKNILSSELDIKIVLGIREEYFARLFEFEKAVPGIQSNRVWVRYMSSLQAEQVIVNPCKVCGVAIDSDVAKSVIAELSQGREGIELPFVQVVMDTLYRRALVSDPQNPHIKIEDVEIQGGVGLIFSNFLENQIHDMADVEKARQVLKSMITSEGTKRIIDIETLAEQVTHYGNKLENSLLSTILRDLVNRRILLEDPENGLFELRHDILAQTIKQWMTGIEQELMEVRQIVESRFREYQTRGALLDVSTLRYIAPYESRLRLNPELEDFFEKSRKHAQRRRRRLLAFCGAAAGIIILLVSSLAIFGYLKAAQALQREQESLNNLGYVFTEKAERALEAKNFNAARLYAYHALASFDPKQVASGRMKAMNIVLKNPVYPMIYFSKKGGQHDFPVNCVLFSPKGKILASGGGGGNIRLYDLATGKQKFVLKGSDKHVLSLYFSPDGQTLASGYSDGTICLWEVVSGKQKTVFHAGDSIFSVKFSPNGKSLVAAGAKKYGKVSLWNVEKGQRIASLKSHTEFWPIISFSSDGKTIALTGLKDKEIQLWDVDSGNQKTILGKNDSMVTSVCFSPDGKIIASGEIDGSIRLWDINTKKQKALSMGHSGLITCLTFSPDGKTLASGAADTTIRLWDVSTRKEKATFEGHTSFVTSLDFSSDGIKLASGSEDSTVRLWDVPTGKRKEKPRPKISLKKHTNWVESVSYSPDGKSVASAGIDSVRLWDADTGLQKAILDKQEYAWSVVSFSPDGKTLALAGNTVCLLDPTTGKDQAILEGHDDRVEHICFSPSGKTLASASRNEIRLWDMHNSKQKALLKGNNRSSISSISFSPDGRTLASGSYDAFIELWDVESGTNEMIPLWDETKGKQVVGDEKDIYKNSVVDLSFSPNGRTMAVSLANGDICLVDVKTRTKKEIIDISRVIKSSVSFSPDGKILAIGSFDGTIHLWDMDRGEHVIELKCQDSTGNLKNVESLCFSPDGKTLASGSWDNTVRLWDVKSAINNLNVVAPSHANITSPIMVVRLSSDGETLAIGCADASIRLWDMVTGKQKDVLKGHKWPVHSLSFSPDGKILASGSADESIQIWNIKTGRRQSVFDRHTDGVRSVCFSPDGKILASGSADATVRLWDMNTRKQKAVFEGHESSVNCIQFSPDGKILASGENDSTIHLRNVSTGEQIAVLKGKDGRPKDGKIGYKNRIISLSFSPGGETLASGGSDFYIRLWDVKTQQQMAVLKPIRDITTDKKVGEPLESADDMEPTDDKKMVFYWVKKGIPSVYDVCFSPDGKTLASASEDRIIRIWSAKTGQQKAALEGHTKNVNSVCFSPDGKTLVSGGNDKTIRVWDVPLEPVKNKGYGYARSANGQVLAWLAKDKTLRVLDIDSFYQKPMILSTGKDIDLKKTKNPISLSSDGKMIALVTAAKKDQPENYIQVLDIHSGRKKATIESMENFIRSVNFSPDGRLIASTSDEGVRLWDVETGQHKAFFKQDYTSHTRFSPDGKKIFTLPYYTHPKITIWDVSTKQKITEKIVKRLQFFNFSPDGKLVALKVKDNHLFLWDTITRKKRSLKGQNGHALSVCFSPDGKTLVSGEKNGTIHLWDVATGSRKAILKDLESPVRSLGFFPDGNTLASGSGNRICLWDVNRAKQITFITLPDINVEEISISSDGKSLVCRDGHGGFYLQDVSSFLKLKNHRVSKIWIEEEEKRFGLKLENMDLKPIQQEHPNLYEKKTSALSWPDSHPFHWLLKAKNGDAMAMLRLGDIYHRDGKLKKASYWYKKAATAGNEKSARIMKFIKDVENKE